MKQLIIDVLEDMAGGQVNLASEAARKMVATTITAVLKTKGTYTEYGDYELDEQNARATWVCSICGENTFEVDSDYIGSGTNHLECEMKSWDKIKDHINDNVDETDKDKKVDWFEDKHQSSVDKLAEEVVSDNDTNYIYESPDGGETVYKRKMGESKRELVKDWKKIKNNE